MYENIGGKIKTLAKWLFIIVTIGCILTAFTLTITSEAPDESFLKSLLLAVLGTIFALISSWLLYAFGELVEDVHYIRIKYSASGIAPEYMGNGYVCPFCKMSMDSLVPCERCGYVPPQQN